MWQCSYCTLFNEVANTVCGACGLPGGEVHASDAAAVPAAGGGGGGSGERGADRSAFGEMGELCPFDANCRRRDPAHFLQMLHLSEWSCPTCTVVNYGEAARCGTCDGYRGPKLQGSASTSAAADSAQSVVDLTDDSSSSLQVPEKYPTTCPVPSCVLELLSADEYRDHLFAHEQEGVSVAVYADPELVRLRKRYGMDPDPDNASYVQQFQRRLQNLVEKKKLTQEEADGKLREMRASLESGEVGATPSILVHAQVALEWIHRGRGNDHSSAHCRQTSERQQQNRLSSDENGDLAVSASASRSVGGGGRREGLTGGVAGRGSSWVLAGKSSVHCGGDFGDSGWGCGYRNIQMLSGYLLEGPHKETYASHLFDGTGAVPTVPKIQEWLEQAWRRGFDTEGADQLEHSIANTKKLIGATECATVLRSFGVRVHVVDFISRALPADEFERRKQESAFEAARLNSKNPKRKNQKPKFVSRYAPNVELLEFCWRYFAVRQATGETEVFCPPLYLQHEGHSRTVVGVERAENGELTMLLFDPAQPGPAMLSDVQQRRKLQRLRRGTHTFTQGKYQICWVEPGIMTGSELEAAKLIRAADAAAALARPLSSST